jgi:hypothetical protein
MLAISVASAAEPYGINAMLNLDRLPYLTSAISAGQQSSYDRSGGNGDAGQFLYNSNGENVMLDLKGPGCLYDIWTTGFNYGSDYLKAYIDGETTPRLSMTMGNLFAGTNAPFISPMANNDAASSGGFYSYVPLPFAQSIKLVSTGSSYYHVGYHTCMPNASITSWNVSDNISAVRSLWQRCGSDPKPAVTGTTAQGTTSIGAGASATLLDINGPGEITSIKIKIPELGTIGQGAVNPGTVTDNGLAFTGYSQCIVAIDPTNQGVRLKRRFDYGVSDQKANVTVDGVAAGQWFTPGADAITRWRDSSFALAPVLTAGKSSITIRITFVSGNPDWNEFYYWVYSKSAAAVETLTDTLDVGTTASQNSHSYTISGQTWSGTQSFSYPNNVVPAPLDVLNNIRIRISYDNDAVPGVDAPLGAFFAMGQFGGFPTRSLMVGADSTNYLYCFFPMPFARHCTIQLASARPAATANVAYEVVQAPFTNDFNHVGYFKTRFNHDIRSGSDGNDMVILDTTGSGKFLGLVQSFRGSNNSYLEGDERIYIDNNRSPAFHGTGTEDLYQGGWYFNKGRFTLPMHGAPVVSGTDNVAYRFFFQDAVPFRTRLRASIEHGDGNGNAEETWILAYYYAQPLPSAAVTDSLDIGNASSETAHGYAADSSSWSGSLTSTFEGDFDNVSITHAGKSVKGSTFTMAISPANCGVIVRKMFDQNMQPQSASVTIDNTPVGTWYKAGSNTAHRWREDEFMIPSSATAGKTSITLHLVCTPGAPALSEFKYWAYTLIDTGVVSPVAYKPNRDIRHLPLSSHAHYSLAVYGMDGKLAGRYDLSGAMNSENIRRQIQHALPSGMYLTKVSGSGFNSAQKVIRYMGGAGKIAN